MALDAVAAEIAHKRRVERERLLPTQPILTIAARAEALGCSPESAREWLLRHVSAGQLVAVQLDNGPFSSSI